MQQQEDKILSSSDHSAMDNSVAGSIADSTETKFFVDEAFPEKLYRMLEDNAGNPDRQKVVSWTPRGHSFCIFDKKRFQEEIMPRYFDSSKFLSFQRSLNLWGFVTQTTKQFGAGERWHPMFVRGKPELCKHIKRTRVKKPGTRSKSKQGDGPAIDSKSAKTQILDGKNQQLDTTFHCATSPIVLPSSTSYQDLPRYSHELAAKQSIALRSSLEQARRQKSSNRIIADPIVQMAAMLNSKVRLGSPPPNKAPCGPILVPLDRISSTSSLVPHTQLSSSSISNGQFELLLQNRQNPTTNAFSTAAARRMPHIISPPEMHSRPKLDQAQFHFRNLLHRHQRQEATVAMLHLEHDVQRLRQQERREDELINHLLLHRIQSGRSPLLINLPFAESTSL